MPLLEPDPQNGQKKLLMIVALIFGIMILIGIIATVAAP
ncbi:hypothetical protein K378_03339 [Streptomyces sp. Amel2xB2]|nr:MULTISPECIES: SGM_5486 family transporter-associated protein [Streptomyces]RAJ65720.1 hypothetical protein K378_03339 [Streptomyces sp. Amel2xB2]